MPTSDDVVYLLDLPVRLPESATDILRFCTGAGYTTKPTDDPPNVFYEPRLVQPGLLTQSMFSEGCTSGSSSGGWGEIVLSNTTGDLDYLIDCGLDGVAPVVRCGYADKPLSTFAPNMPGTVEQPEVTLEQVVVRIKDRTVELRVPVQQETYAGNNVLPEGLEGTADLKDKYKPLLSGKCNNCTPVLVNSSKLIYQISSGLCGIPGVYDNGVPLTAAADYSTLEDLLATAPAAGCYSVFSSVTGTYFRLGSSPAGLITSDGIETAINTAGQIIKRRVSAVLGEDQIVAQSIIDMDRVAPYVVGFFASTDAVNVSDLLDNICGDVGGWWGFDLDNHFWAKQLTSPVAAQALLNLSDLEIETFERLATADSDKGLPVYRVNVDFSRNWTVQTTGLAGSVQAYQQIYDTDDSEQLTAERRALLGMEYIRTKQEDLSVLDFHPLAAEITLKTTLDQLADANTEAIRVLNLRKVRRDRIKVRCDLAAIKYPAGGYWDDEAISEMPVGRHLHACVVHNNYLYVVGGGLNSGELTASIIRLDLLNPTSGWDDAGVSDLPLARAGHACVVHNNYLYAIGGYNNSDGFLSSIIRLDLLNPTSSWDDAGVSDLPELRSYHACVVHNNYLYVIGGTSNGSAALASVIRLNLSTPTSGWDDTGVSDLLQSRIYCKAVVYDGKLYVLGGRSGGGKVTYYSSIHSLDLSSPTSAWDTNLPNISQGVLINFAVVVDGNYLYLLGGRTTSTYLPFCERLDLSNPSIGWDDLCITDLPEGRSYCDAVLHNDAIYLIGGFTTITTTNTWRLRRNSNPVDAAQLISLGRTLNIKYPRYGYTNGRAMKLIGTEKDQQANKITLELWG